MSGAEVKLLAEPTALMRATVARVAESIAAMVQECAEHGLPLSAFAMHVQLNTDREPKAGVPATFIDSDDGVIMIAPMPFAGFRGMSRDARRAPLLKAILEAEGKLPSDLVIACTDTKLKNGFVGYAVRDFGLPPFEQAFEPPPGFVSAGPLEPQCSGCMAERDGDGGKCPIHGVVVPKHIREARAIAAEALVSLDPQSASAAIHGGTAWEKMTKARRVAGADWPEVEDVISTILLAFGTPADWGDLLSRLAREKTRYGMWWLDQHGEHPAGIAFVVQNPTPMDAIACLKGGMTGEKWTAETCPNATLGKRIVPMTSTFVWYADEVFAAAEAAEKTGKS